MASVSIDGSQWVGPPQRSNADLQRASTVSAGTSSFNIKTQRPGPGTNASVCCSGDMKRAHSIHVCIKTGVCHRNHCTKEHLPKKMCQNLLSKLSAISKLRRNSQSSTDDSTSTPPARKLRHWLRSNPKSRSRVLEQSMASTVEDEHVRADPVGEVYEAYGDYYFPHATLVIELPSRQVPSPQLVGNKSDLFSELPDTTVPVFELDSAIPPMSELPEASTIHRNQPKASTVDQYQHQLPKPQTSTVSAFSSFDQSSGSEGHWSWERPQWSSVSEISPATSTSETDWIDGGLLHDSQVNIPSFPRRRLTLDTQLAVPEAPFTDDAVTDSPTAGDVNDFAGLHPENHPAQEVVGADFALSDPDVDFYEEWEVPVPSSWDHQLLLSPEDVQPSSPKLTGTPKDTPDMFDIGSHLPPPPYSAHPVPEDENLVRVLEKYRQQARVMSVHYHKNLLTVIEDAFDLTVSHYLADVAVKRASRTMKLRDAWSDAPTIDAAFYGMHELLTKDAIPTTYQLVSMAFLSLSVLGLSLGISDLILATHNLHRDAKSWSSMIDCPKEKELFEDLVDDLWLLAGRDQHLTQIDEVAHAYRFPQGAAQLQQAGSENFVVQVAQQFIQFTTAASLQISGSSQPRTPEDLCPPPTFEEVVEQDLKTMLAACGCRSTGRGDDSLSNAIQEAKDRGLLDSHDSVVNFVHASYDDEGIDENFGLLRQIKDLLKVLGSRYIGRVSLWLYKRLQITAGRVVSHSQGLTNVGPQAWPVSQDLSPEVYSPPSSLLPDKKKYAPSIQFGSQTDGPKHSGTSPGRRQVQRRKSSTDASSEGPFECKLHGRVFKGKYAWQRYKRHLERTKQHTRGNEPFRCHRCPARMARIEHFQGHMKKYHNLLVVGRKGSYMFRAIPDVDNARAELADTAVAGGEGWVPIIPAVMVD